LSTELTFVRLSILRLIRNIRATMLASLLWRWCVV